MNLFLKISDLIETALVHAIIITSLSMCALMARASENQCDSTVIQFFNSQVEYEKATTEDDVDNVAAEIESQFDCDLNRF
jgi:hypothetical protein